MRGQELLETIENLNPAYIEAAAEKPKAKRSGWFRWGTIAACVCMIIAGTAVWSIWGQQGKIPEFGAGVGGEEPGGNWPDGIDPVIASVAVIPAGEDLKNVADAVSIPITEEDAREVEELGKYLPTGLPEDCRYGRAAHYRTMMKDGTEYQMLRVTYESGEASIPAPVPENGETTSEVTGNTAFLWMVWGHRPDTDRPVYQPYEISLSLIEQQGGLVFYIDYGGILVGIERMDIPAEDLLAIIEAIG